MPRPSQIDEKRKSLLPIVARAFAELGYRRTSTAELAERCGVQENILYRLWPDKKAMFIAAIDYVYDLAAKTWAGVVETSPTGSAAEKLLAYESSHLGQFGHSRIVFAGLSELDDPEIRKALARMYERYLSFVQNRVAAHRNQTAKKRTHDDANTAWAFIGLGTVALIARELKLLNERDRQLLMTQIGQVLLA